MIRHPLQTTILGFLLAILPTTSSVLRAEDPVAATSKTTLAHDLNGTWILVGEPGKMSEPPVSGGRLKFLTGTHWVITQADPTTGVVIFHHGGTYNLHGDEYTETVEYAAESTKDLIKQSFKFTLKIEGDTLTQTGIGNPWTEVWKRLK